MKPSEIIRRYGVLVGETKDYILITKGYNLEELDKRFINKEELKEKIKKLNLYSYDEERILKFLED